MDKEAIESSTKSIPLVPSNFLYRFGSVFKRSVNIFSQLNHGGPESGTRAQESQAAGPAGRESEASEGKGAARSNTFSLEADILRRFLYLLILSLQLESSHRVIRGDGDQKVNIDDLLTSVGVKPVSGKQHRLGPAVLQSV